MCGCGCWWRRDVGVKLCLCSRVGKGSFKSWQPHFCSTKVWFEHAICCISCFSQRCDCESGEQLKKRQDQKEAAKWGGGLAARDSLKISEAKIARAYCW